MKRMKKIIYITKNNIGTNTCTCTLSVSVFLSPYFASLIILYCSPFSSSKGSSTITGLSLFSNIGKVGSVADSIGGECT